MMEHGGEYGSSSEEDSSSSLVITKKNLEEVKRVIEESLGVNVDSKEPLVLRFFIVSGNRRYLASFCDGSILVLWNICTSALKFKLKLLSNEAIAAVFTNDEKRIFISFLNGDLVYLEIGSKQIVTLSISSYTANHLFASCNYEYILCTFYGGECIVIDSYGLVISRCYPYTISSTVLCGVYSRLSSIWYLGATYGKLYKVNYKFEIKFKVHEYGQAINCIALTFDEQFICFGTDQNEIFMMDVRDESIQLIAGTKSRPNSLIFYEENKFIASFKSNGEIHCYDLEEKTVIQEIHTNLHFRIPLLLMNESTVLFASTQNTIRQLSLNCFNQKCFFSLNSITCYIIAVNNKDIIIGCQDGTIIVWSYHKRTRKHILSEHSSSITSLFITFNKKYLASSSSDLKIILWQSTNYSMHCIFYNHDLRTNFITCDRLSRLLITSSEDFTIRIWNIEEKLCIKTIVIQEKSISNFITTKNKKYHVDSFMSKGKVKFRIWRFFDAIV